MPSSGLDHQRQPLFRLDALLGLTIAYTLFAWLGLQWSTILGAASPVWPSSGVAVAGLILGGIRLWPAILAGRLAAGILSGSDQPLWAEAALAIANTVAAVLPLMVLQRTKGLDRTLPDLAQLLRYIGWCGLGGALLAASLGTLTMALAVAPPPLALAGTFANWVFAYFVGVVLIGTLLLAWCGPSQVPTAKEVIHFITIMLVTIGFSSLFLLPPDQAYLRTWHVFPVLVWAALAFGLRGASTALTIIGVTAVWTTDRGMGPMTAMVINAQLPISLVQQFIAVTALTVLVLAVVANERRGKLALAAQGKMLQAAEENARAKAEELEVTLAAVPAAIWVARDPDCRTIIGNRFAAELLRLPNELDNMSKSPAHNPSVSHFTVLDKNGAELKPEELPVQRAARGEVIKDFEETLAFADGTVLHLLGNATPLRAPDGTLRGAVAAFIDITERTAAQMREQLLSREVDHRAKNIMAVVQAIVQLTEADNIASYRRAISGRINSLARTHTLLAQNRWDGAELGELIREELAPYTARDGASSERVTLDGPSVALRAFTAQSIALIIHELITNAVKHGSLSVPDGKITVTWRFGPPGPDQRVQICWTESGGPPAHVPAQSGFGLALIEASARDQLNGTIKHSWSDTGLMVEFTVPTGDLFRPENRPAS